MEHGEPAVPSGDGVAVSLALPWRLETGASFRTQTALHTLCLILHNEHMATTRLARLHALKYEAEDEGWKSVRHGHDETWKDTHEEGGMSG